MKSRDPWCHMVAYIRDVSKWGGGGDVSMSLHFKNPTQHFGLEQSGHHHYLIKM